MTLTPDTILAAKGHLGDLADSIHAAYWLKVCGARLAAVHADATRDNLTRLAAALGYRLIPTEGDGR